METPLVDRTDIHHQEGPLDLATALAVIVAALIVFSGYFLFNGVPTLGNDSQPRRRPRRS